MLPLSEKMVAMASFSGENAAVGFLCREVVAAFYPDRAREARRPSLPPGTGTPDRRDQETFSTQTIAENGLLETFGDVWRLKCCWRWQAWHQLLQGNTLMDKMRIREKIITFAITNLKWRANDIKRSD